jgi:transcriptional regulator with XRE-family HTH domain
MFLGGELMKDRLKQLRKTLNLTQQEFAERIGVNRSTIAGYETGVKYPIDAICTSICREYNVNEKWLKTGEGEMFNQSLNDEFEALCERRNFNPQERKLMKSFMNLPKEERTAFMKLVDYLVDGILLEPDQKITEEELNRRVAAYEERLRTHLQADEDK